MRKVAKETGKPYSFRGSIGVSEARSEWASAVGKEPLRPAAEAIVQAIWVCSGAIHQRAKIGRASDGSTSFFSALLPNVQLCVASF